MIWSNHLWGKTTAAAAAGGAPAHCGWIDKGSTSDICEEAWVVPGL